MPMSLSLLPAILSISSSVSLPHCDRISPLSSFHLACRSLESICLFSFLKLVWLISYRWSPQVAKNIPQVAGVLLLSSPLLSINGVVNNDLLSGFFRQRE